MEIENTIRFLNDYSEKMEEILSSKYRSLGYELADKMFFNVVQFDKVYKVVFNAAPYFKWVEGGRKPGKFPPQSAILEWIERKGIQPRNGISKKSLTYLVSRKIAREGIKPKPMLRETLQETEDFKDELINNYIKDVRLFKSKLMEIWKQ